MKKYSALLFDADNTLFDFTACERAAVSGAMKHFGLPCSDEMLRVYSRYNEECWLMLERGEISKERLVVLRYERFFDHYGIGTNPAEVEDYYETLLSQQAVPMPGAADLLRRFWGRAGIYIITNGLTRVQRGRFSRSELLHYVNDVFISEEMGTKKPDARFFKLVAERIPGFTREGALVIGDSLSSDILGANNYRLDCVWFNPQGKINDTDLRITKTVGGFPELAAFLEEHT